MLIVLSAMPNSNSASVADPDPGSGGWVKNQDPDHEKTFFGLKYLNSLMWIRDAGWKN
jgi:hypothetical protein